MNGWLCYDEIGAQKNAWFIEHLIDCAKKQGLSLQLQIIKEPFCFTDLPDFAIVRFICPKLNRYLQDKGVRVFNNAHTAEIACDKWKTHIFLTEHGIPVLPTEKAVNATLPYPCILKTRDGHGGSEVFFVQDEAQKCTLLSKYDRENCIVQQPSDTLGKDMRVYAVGGEIIACVLRESDKDFRSNFSLGGRVSLAQADETQRNVVANLYQLLHFDFIGIDFIPTKTGWVVNELEDAAGARMLYSLSDIDIACYMIEHIAHNL